MGDHLGTPSAVGLKMLFRTLSENIKGLQINCRIWPKNAFEDLIRKYRGLVDWFEINCSLAFLGPYQKIMLGYTVCSVVALLHRYAILLCFEDLIRKYRGAC